MLLDLANVLEECVQKLRKQAKALHVPEGAISVNEAHELLAAAGVSPVWIDVSFRFEANGYVQWSVYDINSCSGQAHYQGLSLRSLVEEILHEVKTRQADQTPPPPFTEQLEEAQEATGLDAFSNR